MSNRMKQILKDYTITKDGRIYDKEGVEVDTFINSCGYVSAVLNGYIVTVAYIVAKLYVENPNNAICIAYNDNNYTNINADNLKWYYEGEMLIEDNAVIVVNEEGEIINYYNTVTQCADDFEVQNQTIISKCNGRIAAADDYYLFFEEEFNREEFNRRKAEKEKRLKEKEQRESIKHQYKLDNWVESCKQSNSLEVVEFNSDGEIIEEYNSITAFMSRYNISYLKADKIINQTLTYNNNYILYKKYFNNISDIKLYIQKVNQINQREAEEKEQKRLELLEIKQRIKEEQKRIRENKQRKRTIRIKRELTEEQKRIKEQKQQYKLQLEEERKEKIRQNNVLQFDYKGNLIGEYKNYKQAAKEIDLSDVTIASICNGKSKQRNEYYLIFRKDYNKETILDKIKNADKVSDNKVMAFDYNGNLLKIYNTAVQAAKALNTTDVNVNYICNGKSKQRKECYLIYSKDYDEKTILDKIKNADKITDKRVVKLDNDGNFIKMYDTAVEASKELCYSVVTIGKICQGKMKQREDYILIYNEDYNEDTIK